MPAGDVWGNSWLDAWGASWAQSQEGAAPEPPTLTANDISVAFSADMRGITPTALELRQMARIAFMARRDARMAAAAYRLLKRRAEAARRALRSGKEMRA